MAGIWSRAFLLSKSMRLQCNRQNQVSIMLLRVCTSHPGCFINHTW